MNRSALPGVVPVLLGMAILLAACSAPAAPTATPGQGDTSPSGQPSTSASPAPNPSIDVTEMQKPSTASLIQAAVDEGSLDPVTALEYRAMAMFGVPGLPEEFAAGVPRSDSAALAAIAAMMDDLPAADQARLQPYLLRPTQPGSVFYASPVASHYPTLRDLDRFVTTDYSQWSYDSTIQPRGPYDHGQPLQGGVPGDPRPGRAASHLRCGHQTRASSSAPGAARR